MKHLLNWFRRRTLENGLGRELQYHMDRRIAELTQSGKPDWEARRMAALELGGITQVQEEVRDVWLTRWLRDFAYDLRYSARSFLRTPSFTATAVLSFALGIGATTAIYSLVDQIILHALPVREPQSLVLIDWKGEQVADGFGTYNLMSYPICRDLQLQERFFDGVLCRAATTVNLSTGGDHKPALAEIVSGNYFSVLGITPAMGRLIEIDDDRTPGASPVVVLSHDFWRTQLAGDPDVLGRKVLVNQHPMTVIGVASPAFRGIDVGEVPSMWIPASMSEQAIPGFKRLLDRRQRWMQILGRLKPNVTLTQAQAGLQPWFKAMLQEDTRLAGFPVVNPEMRRSFLASSLELTPAPHGHSSLRRRLTQPLWVLLAATGVLLGLACLNVAGLCLARGSARNREISTRLALGASGGRIGRQLLSDSLLLAFAGGLLGIALAPVAMQALIAFLPADVAANALKASIDLRLLRFVLIVSVAAGVITGFAPALQAARGSLISSLRERGGASGGLRLRRLIVTAQIALTLILVIGAALFVRTLTGLLTKGPGFNTSSLISFGIDPRKNGYSPAETARLITRIQDEIRASGAMQASAVARYALLTGGSWNNPMTIQTDRRFTTDRDIDLNAVSPGFFATLGAKLVAGRDFNERDSLPVSQGGTRTAIVNVAFANKYFAGRSPLGALICQGVGPNAKPDTEIVGVMSDINYRGLRIQSQQAYFPMESDDGSRASYYVRAQGSPDVAFKAIRSILNKVDPTLPIAYFRTVDEQVNRSLNTERLLAVLSSSFGTLALLLSLVGLYGVMSFLVTQRTREIGIRLALGATRSAAIWLVLRDAVVMIGAGIAVAVPSVWILGRWVESQLYEVKPADPVVIAAATAILCSTTLIAALIPAHRASVVNPTEALRFE